MKSAEEDKAIAELRDIVSSYLDNNVKSPSLETIDSDIYAQARLAALLLLVKKLNSLAYEHGADFNEEYICQLSEQEIKRRLKDLSNVVDSDDFTQAQERVNIKDVSEFLWKASSKKPLLAYLSRELNWITISILSASYVSSLILMRSVFELIIGIASKQTGKMADRIGNISFLDNSEKKTIKELWYRLCSWGHPYGKWIKEICPLYSSRAPVYHQVLCEMCMKELERIVDLLTVVILATYDIEHSQFAAMLNKLNIDITGLELVKARLEK